eukprot:11722621-Alexandrium_andersonii.AAC.1
MSASLVGSEMCIRDSFLMAWEHNQLYIRAAQGHSGGVSDNIDMSQALEAVSYTHLTLPTICSV